MNEPFDLAKVLRDYPDKFVVPGGLLTKRGPQDYVGAVPSITGTLYFKDAHTQPLREAICDCFADYEQIASSHLTWLWREEPPEGPDRMAYSKAKPLPEMMAQLTENHAVSFGYISGKKPHDAGEWEFQVHGMHGWEAKMGSRGLSSLRFALPLLYVEQNPLACQTLFVKFAQRLRASHGYAGHALVSSLIRSDDCEPFEAYLCGQLKGLDVGGPIDASRAALHGIKTVSWLTAINREMVEKIGGLSAIRSELPMDWFALYDYGSGLVIQAGPEADAAAVSVDPLPARYVLPNMLLREVRTPELKSLHRSPQNGEQRIIGWAAEQWLKRFDVPEEELMAYKAKLLKEPKLSPKNVLPERL